MSYIRRNTMKSRISPAEWQVLETLWDRAPATAAEVYEALGGDAQWHFKTVNTFLARLVDKGALSVHRDGKANVYAPKFNREQCVRQESDTFLKRFFRGAAGPMLAHFCERADLTESEIAQLRQILDQRLPGKSKKKGGAK